MKIGKGMQSDQLSVYPESAVPETKPFTMTKWPDQQALAKHFLQDLRLFLFFFAA